jgi:predicted permease
LGRGFLPEEDQGRGKAPVAVISYNLWQRMFHGDAQVLGSLVRLNGHLYRIVGVAPKSFTGLDLSYRPDIYVPMAMIADIVPVGGGQLLDSRHSRSFVVRGRLHSGVTVERAQAEANLICAALARQYPATNQDTNFILRRDLDYRMQGNGVVLPAVLMGLVLLVLLIACANVASLLLTRATTRIGTIAIQSALGASRARLLQQLITESAVLTTLGGACGFLSACWGVGLAMRLVPYQPSPQGPLFQIDARGLSYALAASAATVFLCGLAPAFLATREAARAALRVRSSANRGFGLLARRALIACQVALSVMLLIAGGLFIKGFARLQNVDLGFNPDHVFIVTINTALYNYTPTQTEHFFKELLARSAALPGVKSASLAAIAPFLGLYSQDISIDGYLTPGGDKVLDILTNRVSPGYFETLRIPFTEGRNFTENDKAGSLKVAIVNETFARRFIVGQGDLTKALGHAFRRRDGVPIQVVGIVKDSTYGTTTPLGLPASPVFYTPVLQSTDSYMAIQVRTERGTDRGMDRGMDGLGTAIYAQIHALDPQIAPIYSLPLATVVSERALYVPRVTAVLSAVFAVIALTVAIIGLYGAVSYTVECRTQEIGIRMALGARRSRILWMILRSSISLVILGLMAGTFGAMMLSPYLAGLLVGVSSRDPVTFVLLPVVMLMATAVASFIPAARATRVEPVIALRHE